MEVPRRRSIFADRLKEFADFAFGGDRVGLNRGRWGDLFQTRLGPAFSGRIVLEIGCSDGDLLARMAARHPTTAFIGLDWKHKSLFMAAERVGRLGLKNVALLRGRGQDLTTMFGPGEVDEILLFHPDPFAEADELPNRLFAEPFLIDAHSVLRDGDSVLTLKTDHPGYYGWALALFGLDDPESFAAARTRAEADPALANRLTGEPRIRAADLLSPTNRPAESAAAVERFTVAASTADFWNDPTILERTAPRPFAGERTFFEERFLKKRQPIYFLDLPKLS